MLKKKSILISMLVLALLVPVFAVPSAFIDVSGHWAQDIMLEMVDLGIIQGTSPTTVSPDLSLKTYEWELMISRALGKPVEDVTLRTPITREEAISLLYQQTDKVLQVSQHLNFSDLSSISTKAMDAVKWGFRQEIIMGYPDDTFKPKGNLTRAEGLVILKRFLNMNKVQASNDLSSQLIKVSDQEGKLIIRWGEKPTGGYSVIIDKVTVEGQTISVFVTTKSPDPDAMVTQVISYPKAEKVLNIDMTQTYTLLINP